ncbi:hypothetical protein VKT23_018138 [Stygiomarasmius scandens]|uniref:Mid2 domain-containing protein n=1 Tax=Marasmiellus scandens TaxID=2682957 RepID=A0ABR1ISE9_9AGAR
MSSLSPGEHTVVVTHNGTTSGMPLTIDYFLVTSLTAAERVSLESTSTSAPTPTSSSPNSPPSQPSTLKHDSKKVIIGGTLGGVAALCLVALLIFLWTKRRGRAEGSGVGVLDPFVQGSAPDYDPYNPDSTSHPKARELASAGQQPNGGPSTTGQNGEFNTMRLGILKLQQRLAVRPEVRPTQTSESQAMDERLQEARGMIHTDSGWRMRDQRALSNPADIEIPPGYTEA